MALLYVVTLTNSKDFQLHPHFLKVQTNTTVLFLFGKEGSNYIPLFMAVQSLTLLAVLIHLLANIT